MTEKEIEQLRAELMQMQLDANAVCQSLGVKWAADGNYPSFAVQAVGTLRGRAARGEWQRDEAQAELAQAQTEIARVNKISDGYATGWADACAARDALARECNHLEEDREYNAVLVTGKDRELAQARDELAREHQIAKATMVELKRVHKSAHVEAEGLRRQLKHAEGERDYWLREHDALICGCHSEATTELSERLATLDAVEAALATERQLRREAEDELGNGHKSLTAAGVSQTYNSGESIKIASRIVRLRQRAMATNKALAASRKRANKAVNQLSRDGERAEALAAALAEAHAMLSCSPQTPWSGCKAQEYSNEAHYMCHAREAQELLGKVLEGETPTNTQALAALVNEETMKLLWRLARNTWDCRSDIPSVMARYDRDAKAARALAAQIKEALR